MSRAARPAPSASRKDRQRLDEARARLHARLVELSGASELSRFDEALTHPSYSNEVPGLPDNQRLEFLGDAVLGLCVSEVLARRTPRPTRACSRACARPS